MPNLVYYKDGNGVVSGPIREPDATALYKGNFFKPDHVFRVVDSKETEEYCSIDDLRSLNGAETPFGKIVTDCGEEGETKESIRVYKELVDVMRERNQLKKENGELKVYEQRYKEARTRMLQTFKHALQSSGVFTISERKPEHVLVHRDCRSVYHRTISNSSPVAVQMLIGDTWEAEKSVFLDTKCSVRIDENPGPYVYVAPYLFDDPLNVSEHVLSFRIVFGQDESMKFP